MRATRANAGTCERPAASPPGSEPPLARSSVNTAKYKMWDGPRAKLWKETSVCHPVCNYGVVFVVDWFVASLSAAFCECRPHLLLGDARKRESVFAAKRRFSRKSRHGSRMKKIDKRRTQTVCAYLYCVHRNRQENGDVVLSRASRDSNANTPKGCAKECRERKACFWNHFGKKGLLLESTRTRASRGDGRERARRGRGDAAAVP